MTTTGDDGPAMELRTVYVCVEDMDRALSFYRDLFDTDPKQTDERFSTFAFGDVDFGLYNPSYGGDEIAFGDNCVPNFEVADVEAAYERVAPLAPEVDDEIRSFGDYRRFRLVDTEGNELEVFSVESE